MSIIEGGVEFKSGRGFITVMFKDYVIITERRGRNKYLVWIRRNNTTVEKIEIERNTSLDPTNLTKIEDPSDKEALAEIVSYIAANYDDIAEEEKLRAIEKIARDPRFTKIPKPPTDYERLITVITDHILRNRIVKTFTIRLGGAMGKEVVLGIYCYDKNGVYVECEEDLRSEVRKFTDGIDWVREKTINRVVNETISRIEDLTKTELLYERHSIVLGNKVFDWDLFLQTGDLETSLKDPSPDRVVFHRIPWRIDTEKWRRIRRGLEAYIPPKNIKEVVETYREIAPRAYEIFLSWVKAPEDNEETADLKVGLLLQVIGYTMYPHDYPFHKAVLLVGEGSNGKTTFLGLIEKILGTWNVAHVNLRDLDPRVNRFAAADLYGKLANISSEPVRGSFDPTLFKMITGEDYVRIERKFRDAFDAKLYAKMIFAANTLPEVTEDTKGFWDRWIVILFPNMFPRTMSREEFIEKNLVPEIQEIIISSLYAFYVAMKTGGFVSAGLRDPKEEWLRRSNPVYSVLRDMIEDGLIVLDKSARAAKSDVYQLYVNMCRESDEKCVEKRELTLFLERFFGVKSIKAKIPGKRIQVYQGIGLTEKGYSSIENSETPREWIIKANQ